MVYFENFNKFTDDRQRQIHRQAEGRSTPSAEWRSRTDDCSQRLKNVTVSTTGRRLHIAGCEWSTPSKDSPSNEIRSMFY